MTRTLRALALRHVILRQNVRVAQTRNARIQTEEIPHNFKREYNNANILLYIVHVMINELLYTSARGTESTDKRTVQTHTHTHAATTGS